MKKILKKSFSLLVAIAMLTALMPVAFASASSEEGALLYPDAAYTAVSDELDASGGWKYRELIPDVNCENIKYFAQKYKLTPATLVTDIEDAERGVELSTAYSGNYSIKGSMSGYSGLGTEVECLVKDANYLISYSGKISPKNNDLSSITLYYNVHAQGPNKDNSETTTTKDGYIGSAAIGTDWTTVSMTKTMLAANNASIDVTKPMVVSFSTNALKTTVNDASVNAEFDLWIDDWSMRMAIPANFPSSYVKSITPAPSRPLVKNGDTVKFTYSLDIDPRTVRKENIIVNGETNSNYISAVNVSTDEATRETVLSITMANMTDGARYEIALPSLKDAWGRDVIGASTATVYAAEVAADQYTIFGDLDATGQWKYRELIPDVNCENINYFALKANTHNKDVTSLDDSARGVELSTDAYSGDYSIAGDITGYGGPATQVDYLEGGEKYRSSLMVKMDPENESLTEITTFQPAIITNTPYVDTALSGTYKIGTDWTENDITITLNADVSSTALYKTLYFSPAGTAYNTDGNRVKLYIDDWSFRRMVPDEFQATELISAAGNKNEAVFKFNLDIDPRTVRKENITINGTANSNNISAVNVSTNEITRETTVTVSLQNLTEGAEYEIALPSLEDAWGREVSGAASVQFTAKDFVIGAANIIDANGDVVQATDMTAGTRSYKVTGIQNNSNGLMNISSLIALYDDMGKLYMVGMDPKTFTSGTQDGELCASVTIPQDATGYSIKTFLWNMETLCPYN